MYGTSINCIPTTAENHPYDVCEVITTSIEDGNKEYIDWIGKVVPAAAAGKTEGSS